MAKEMPKHIATPVKEGIWTQAEAEYAWGYFDGRRIDTDEPGPDMSPRYVHSFRIGRAEINGTPYPSAAELRRKAGFIDAMLED